MIEIKKGKYNIYHIPGVKVGCTTNVQKRIIEAQGYKPGEYEILFETDNVAEASKVERQLQKDLGYKIDRKLYKDLFKKVMNKHSSSAATTTFKVSSKDLNAGFLAALEIKPLPKNLHIKATITTAPATLQCIREPKLSASIWNFAAPPAAYFIATGIR